MTKQNLLIIWKRDTAYFKTLQNSDVECLLWKVWTVHILSVITVLNWYPSWTIYTIFPIYSTIRPLLKCTEARHVQKQELHT